MPELTILTPCFNRLTQINRLFNSLSSQTSSDFQWLVVDDGSTDGTKQWFNRIDKTSFLFEIDYHYKENGGKHTALNYAHQYIKGNYVVVVDSDDVLVKDAVEIILKYWERYSNNKLIGGITFQKGNLANHNKFDENICGIKKSTFLIMTNRGMSGDHCETFRTNLFTKKDFPIYKKEKFVAEGAMWYLITKEYQVLYVDKVIYLVEYLEKGLTRSGRKLRISNPRGSRWHAQVFLDKDFSLKIRIKNAILYDTYSHFIGERYIKSINISQYSRFLLTLLWLPTYGLYYIWKKKYDN